MLPKMSGFLVLERMRRGRPKNEPWIIMITGNPGARHKAYALALGVKEYLNKPFTMDVLKEKVKKAPARPASET